MGFKHFVGTVIRNIVENMIAQNYKSVPFIPNGRILPLDLKRASVNPRVIFDVGANEGQTANYFAKHFKDAIIYSFEPVMSVYQKMVANTSNTRIKCFHQALGDRNGEAKIYKATDYSGNSSLNGVNNENLPDEETIQMTTGMSICEEYKISAIDILKIDTEGFEISALEGFKPLLKNGVKFIYIEASFDINNKCQTYITTLLNYLQPYGFIMSGLYAMHRTGFAKLKLSHCDLLLTNTNLVDL